jgi:hypothetical protein
MTHEEPRKYAPPYLPFSSFAGLLDAWRAVHPSRVDRSVLGKYSGSTQTWLISTLRYFSLIDLEGVPTAEFVTLLGADDDQRKRLLADLARRGYPALFERGFDLSKATQSQVRDKFSEMGSQGETQAKAISFFTGLAKAAEIPLSPFVTTRQRRAGNGKRRGKGEPKAETSTRSGPPTPTPPPPPPHTTPAASKTAFEVLYELLDLNMDEAEQQAVWTLLRYLKKGRT